MVSCGCATVAVATGETGETVSMRAVAVVSRGCATVAVATGETVSMRTVAVVSCG